MTANKRQMALLQLSVEGILPHFMSIAQRATCADIIKSGEEADHFADIILGLAERIRTMPKTYEQDGNPNPTAYLRYFGGAATVWITEKDMGTDDPLDNQQVQAYGYVDLYGGGFKEAEAGYVSILDLISNNLELDFHFEPTTKKDLGKGD